VFVLACLVCILIFLIALPLAFAGSWFSLVLLVVMFGVPIAARKRSRMLLRSLPQNESQFAAICFEIHILDADNEERKSLFALFRAIRKDNNEEIAAQLKNVLTSPRLSQLSFVKDVAACYRAS
jgi:hypothetical protein